MNEAKTMVVIEDETFPFILKPALGYDNYTYLRCIIYPRKILTHITEIIRYVYFQTVIYIKS